MKAYQLLGRIKWGVKLQPVYEAVMGTALVAMNCGPGNAYETSGESYVLKYVSDRIRRLGHPPAVIFDIGANVGDYTKHAFDIFTPPPMVYAFEPVPATYEELCRNIAHHGDRARAFNFGFSASSSQVPVYSSSGQSSISSLYPGNLARFAESNPHEETVTLRTVDEFCAEQGISHVDFMKIDVEGHELSVLQGAGRMLDAASIDYIQFEFGTCDIESRTFMRDFFRLLEGRYNLYRVVRDGLHPLPHYREIYEVFFNTANYFAARRSH